MKAVLKHAIQRSVAKSAAGWARLHLRPSSVLERADRRQNALMRQVLRKTLRNDSNCIDVGAHRGDILAQMIRLAPEGRFRAFEPIPQLATELQARFPGVAVHNLALGDRVGQAPFYHVVSNPAYSGLKRRAYPRSNEEVRLIQVRTERLDNLVARDERVDVIKIDVEGAELQVLRGATRTLKRWQPFVLFEHGRGASEHYGTSAEMLYRLLVEDCGLRINQMGRYLKGQPGLSLDEFVAVTESGLVWNFIAKC